MLGRGESWLENGFVSTGAVVYLGGAAQSGERMESPIQERGWSHIQCDPSPAVHPAGQGWAGQGAWLCAKSQARKMSKETLV